MWFKWEDLYKEVMDTYKKMTTMKNDMYDRDGYDADGYDEYGHDEYGYKGDRHREMENMYPPMPNTPLGQLFMENFDGQMDHYEGDRPHRRPHENRKPNHGPKQSGDRYPSHEGNYKEHSLMEMAMNMLNQGDMDTDYMMKFGMDMIGKAMEMFDGMDMQTILPMAMGMVQNTAGLDLSTILEVAKMFM